MKNLIITVVAVAVTFLLADQAFAAFLCRHCPPPCCEPCPPPVACTTTFVDKVVTCYKPVWKEEQVECLVNKVVCKEVVEKVKCMVLVPRWYDEKRVCTYLVTEPVEVLREVVRCRLVPVKVDDPCCVTTCKVETYVEKVKCVVPQCKAVHKEVVCKVCRLEALEQIVDRKRLVMECVPTKVLQVRRYCVMVPYQTTVRVPVCVPVVVAPSK